MAIITFFHVYCNFYHNDTAVFVNDVSAMHKFSANNH